MRGKGAAAATVTLNLNPEVEKGLTARAHARGVSLDDYFQELVAKEAGLPAGAEPGPIHKRFDSLSELLLNSPFARANLDLERSKDYARPVDLA
jgi:hypothetical protein